ncbi:MAG: SUMF1/EgtB/PvdO family nonheme iron enzyme [Anaerolineales bacterium]|nr:SUMF1/EgtB/PvdO family nonheme iron enzyme [Anaerolineales bacterium]
MDIAQLAEVTAKFLAPLLPFLIQGAQDMARAAFERAGEKLTDEMWDKGKKLWEKINPKIDTEQDAIKRAEQKPEDKRVINNLQTSLELQLEDVFEQDASFAQTIQEIHNSIVIGGDVKNANILNNSNNNQIADKITNIHYHNASQSDVENEKINKAFWGYLEKIRRQCNALPLAALGGDDKDEEITLDKIYIDLDTTAYKEKLEEASEQDKKFGVTGLVSTLEIVNVLEVAIENKQLVLLGDAGAGKSTFVKKLIALQAAVLLGETKEALTGFDAGLIPVLIVLRDLSPKLANLNLGNVSAENQKQMLADLILEKIQEDLKINKASDSLPVLEEAFEKGKLLLVLDGLDEVPQDMRKLIRQTVGALIQLNRIERIIITSRSRSYVGEAVFPNFQSFTIAPFDREKIEQFSFAWYNERHRLGHITEEQARERARDLSNKSSTRDLIEMSSNPMMLTSIAIIHQKDIGLPDQRVKLYQLVVDVLIKRWQKYKAGEDNFAPSEALTVFLKKDDILLSTLQMLAYEAHRANFQATEKDQKTETDLPRGYILTLLEQSKFLGSTELASEFLDYVDQRSGILVGKGGELEHPTSYSFPHRTIQEYLAGCYLVSSGRNRGREFFKHAAEGDFWSLAALMGAEEIYHNSKNTRDALLDLMYELCSDDSLKNEQSQRALLWSGQIASLFDKKDIEDDTKPNGGKNYLQKLIALTVQLIENDHLSPRERAEAGNVLAKLGDPRIGVTKDFLFCEIFAGKFLMGSKKEDKLSSENEYPQFEYKIQSNYFISRYLVTNAQFEAFVNAEDGYTNVKWWTEEGLRWRNNRTEHDRYGGIFALSNHPVVGIRWYEAVAFCNWATEQTRKAEGRIQLWRDGKIETIQLDEKFEIRLPSEAEWEHAARYGKDFLYPWNSNEITPNHANYSDTNLNSTSAVGIFPLGKNDFGLLDLSGNVWEWCTTIWQKNYNQFLNRENNKSDEDGLRVLRGGAFNRSAKSARCAFRNKVAPDIRFNDIGFRVVVSRLVG